MVEKLGRRVGIRGLHPHSLRHMLATTWVAKGLDTKKLQVLLGHASIATTMGYVDSNLEQLRSEYDKLWGTDANHEFTNQEPGDTNEEEDSGHV